MNSWSNVRRREINVKDVCGKLIEGDSKYVHTVNKYERNISERENDNEDDDKSTYVKSDIFFRYYCYCWISALGGCAMMLLLNSFLNRGSNRGSRDERTHAFVRHNLKITPGTNKKNNVKKKKNIIYKTK